MTSAPYDPRVESSLRAMQANAERFTVEGAELDLRDIPFPALPFYGYDHGEKTMVLAHYIAQVLGVTSKRDLDCVKLAGLFHDVGRQAPFPGRASVDADPSHSMRSADFACEWLKARGTPQARALCDDVGWLISNHSLAKEPPTDPRLQALWDADCYEAARFSPGTAQGGDMCRVRFGMVVTTWAKEKQNQRTYMRSRGWFK